MNQPVKNFLQRLQLYHPLQSFYRKILFIYKRARNRENYKAFKGKGFTCNVCREQYQKFVPGFPSEENRRAIEDNKMVAGYGDNIYCPSCMSSARERLVIAKLSEFDLKGKNVLHLSPEKNIYTFIKDKAEVTSADLLPGFYKTIDGLVQKQDATRFSFADESFDWVIGNHILEHIPDDKKAIQEIFRVLKPGGRAILQVPYTELLYETLEIPTICDAAKQSYLFGQKDHVRIYLLSDYANRLRQAGFNVEIVPYTALEKYYHYAIQQNECFIQILKPTNA